MDSPSIKVEGQIWASRPLLVDAIISNQYDCWPSKFLCLSFRRNLQFVRPELTACFITATPSIVTKDKRVEIVLLSGKFSSKTVLSTFNAKYPDHNIHKSIVCRMLQKVNGPVAHLIARKRQIVSVTSDEISVAVLGTLLYTSQQSWTINANLVVR